MSTHSQHVSRRRFLATVAGAAVAPRIVSSSVLGLSGAVAPSERIAIGVIGIGSRGTDHTRAFMGNPAARVVALCDPYRSKCEAVKAIVDKHYAEKGGGAGNGGCATYQDFRELIARDDIDAVAIAAPENWHALQSVMAMAAGKDVYCEKALSLTVREGRAVVDAVRRHGRVLQVGTQQRSSRDFRFACELARNGYLGELHTVKVGVPGGRELPVAPPTPPPPELDYEMWLGPAPYTPHNDLKGSFNWYFMSDYCVGWVQSWGVHHVDIALWGAPALATGKVKISGTATFPISGLADTSVAWDIECRTEKGLLLSFTDMGRNAMGCRFEGSKGWVHVDRGGIWAEPASLLTAKIQPGEEHLYDSRDHHANFLACVRNRKDPASDVESGHAATTLTIVGDIATRLRRDLTWDWAKERFVNDAEADRMLSRSMRSPWRIAGNDIA